MKTPKTSNHRKINKKPHTFLSYYLSLIYLYTITLIYQYIPHILSNTYTKITKNINSYLFLIKLGITNYTNQVIDYLSYYYYGSECFHYVSEYHSPKYPMVPCSTNRYGTHTIA